MTSTTAELPVLQPTTASWFHISLNVSDLAKSIEFFRAFFGCEPAKCRADYAKFELHDPPLVMSLEPGRSQAGGNLNHLGFRMPDAAALVDLQRRLEIAGIHTRREEGIECCYARQTKFWVHDPDGNLWEVYTLDGDLEHRGDGRLPAPTPAAAANGPAPAVWRHVLGQAFATKLPMLDATVDEAHLQGTFNERLAPDEIRRRLAEVRRVLRPEGRVELHMLTSDRALSEEPLHLPGPAAAVQVAPIDRDVLAWLAEAGFSRPGFAYRASAPCFRVGAAELRETRLEAWRSAT